VTEPKHFVIIAIHATSHLGQLLQLCINLLDLYPTIQATFLYADLTASRFDRALGNQPDDLVRRVKSRLHDRGVYTGTQAGVEVGEIETIMTFAKVLSPVIEGLVTGKGEGGWSTVPSGFFVDVSSSPLSSTQITLLVARRSHLLTLIAHP